MNESSATSKRQAAEVLQSRIEAGQLINPKPVYKPWEFALMIGVSERTLRRWDKAGVFIACRNPLGRPYYTRQHYAEYIKSPF